MVLDAHGVREFVAQHNLNPVRRGWRIRREHDFPGE